MTPEQQLNELNEMRSKPLPDRLAFLRREAEALFGQMDSCSPSMIRQGIVQRFEILGIEPPRDVYAWLSKGKTDDAAAAFVEASTLSLFSRN